MLPAPQAMLDLKYINVLRIMVSLPLAFPPAKHCRKISGSRTQVSSTALDAVGFPKYPHDFIERTHELQKTHIFPEKWLVAM